MTTVIHTQLLKSILFRCSAQAEQILEMHDTESAIFERTVSDLELSPLIDKQLTAAALRLASDLGLAGGIGSSMLTRFICPAPSAAVEPLRRTIEQEVMDLGLPMDLAGDYAHTLERRIAVPQKDLPGALWDYAALYDDFWSDPRIGAGTRTRRIMLAMATVLRARSADLAVGRIRPAASTVKLRSSPPNPMSAPRAVAQAASVDDGARSAAPRRANMP